MVRRTSKKWSVFVSPPNVRSDGFGVGMRFFRVVSNALGFSGFLFALSLTISGCAVDREFTFPVGSEKVLVQVKVQEDLVIKPIHVVYRSSECLRESYNAKGEKIYRRGVKVSSLKPEQVGSSGLYQANVPVDGGGGCQWRLSNMTLDVDYKYPEIFGGNARSGSCGGLTVIFDEDNGPRGGPNFEVEGDLHLKEDYYPWLSERFLGGYRKRVNLLGDGDIFLNYKAKNAKVVLFEPVLYLDWNVYSVGPKVKAKGNQGIVTYPDGSTVMGVSPDHRRMQCLRLNTSCES